MKTLLLLLLALSIVGCASSSDEAPAVKGTPPPVVEGTPIQHERGGRATDGK